MYRDNREKFRERKCQEKKVRKRMSGKRKLIQFGEDKVTYRMSRKRRVSER